MLLKEPKINQTLFVYRVQTLCVFVKLIQAAQTKLKIFFVVIATNDKVMKDYYQLCHSSTLWKVSI